MRFWHKHLKREIYKRKIIESELNLIKNGGVYRAKKNRKGKNLFCENFVVFRVKLLHIYILPVAIYFLYTLRYKNLANYTP